MARTVLPTPTVAIAGAAQPSETTIAAVGGYAVVLTTALPQLGVTLTSGYLAAMVGDIAASHLASSPGRPPQIGQHVLPGEQPGRTHAQTCLLDHVAELQSRLAAITGALVAIDVDDASLELADSAWNAQADDTDT